MLTRLHDCSVLFSNVLQRPVCVLFFTFNVSPCTGRYIEAWVRRETSVVAHDSASPQPSPGAMTSTVTTTTTGTTVSTGTTATTITTVVDNHGSRSSELRAATDEEEKAVFAAAVAESEYVRWYPELFMRCVFYNCVGAGTVAIICLCFKVWLECYSVQSLTQWQCLDAFDSGGLCQLDTTTFLTTFCG